MVDSEVYEDFHDLPDVDSYEEASRLIRENRGKVLAFTGSGISAEAGIPTFRGKDGLWKKYRPEELATPEAFRSNPRKVWEWYKWRMEKIAKAEPTLAHKVLAEWEEEGILIGVVTQNVDGLHQRAGSKEVVELHGSIWKVRCTSCGKTYNLGFGNIPSEELPRCRECGGLLRPAVVWFHEPLPNSSWMMAESMFSRSQVILVVGTSGLVYPAASLPINAAVQGKDLIEINPEDTPITSLARVKIRAKAGEAFKKLDQMVRSQ